MAVDPNHFLEELRINIQSKDSIKARVLLRSFPEVDEATRVKALFELSRAEDDFAAPILAHILARAEELHFEFNQVYQVLLPKILDFPAALIKILQDPSIPDKKPFIELAGKIQCEESLPIIAGILREDSDPDLYEACILAIGSIGDESYITTVSDFLYSGDRSLTFAAVRALADLGTEEAVNRLYQRIGTDQELDMAIVDALAEIQSPASIDKICSLLLSHDPHLRNHAKDILTELGPKAVPVLVKNLDFSDSDLLIHTLNILALTKDPSSARHVRKFLAGHPKDPNVRFAAYEALGELPLKTGAFTLIEGLSDPDVSVRMACAKALNRNIDPILLEGIKNLADEGGPQAEDIVGSIIDSESEDLFLALIDHPSFQDRALAHLNGKAPRDVAARFSTLLSKEGRGDLAEKIASTRKDSSKQGLKIYVVDDSRMILKVFKATLFKLGYPCRLFEFPAGALEAILQEKPDLLFTDLNMPAMNGVELTTRVRERYSKEELPIVMVTTQQDQDDKEAAFKAGVDDIIFKPFTKEMLASKIQRFCDK